MKFLSIAIAILSFGLLSAQDSLSHWTLRQINLKAGLGLESAQWSSSQLLGFYNPDRIISDNDKASLLSALSKDLNLGFRNQWSVELELSREANTSLIVGISERSFLALKAPKAAVNLVLNGNKSTAGTEQDLSQFRFQNWRYVGLDFAWQRQESSLSRWGFSLLGILNHQDYRSEELRFTTAEDGSSISLDGEYRLKSSDEADGLSLQGLGLASHFAWERSMGDFGLHFSIQDLGLAFVSNGRSFSRSGRFLFEGINIGDLNSLGDSLWDAESEALEDEIYRSAADNYWTLLPFELKLRGHYQLSEESNWAELFASIDYINLGAYRPRFAMGASYLFSSSWSFETGLAYGGFNALALPLALAYQGPSHWAFRLYANNALGLVAPGLSGGSWLEFGLGYRL